MTVVFLCLIQWAGWVDSWSGGVLAGNEANLSVENAQGAREMARFRLAGLEVPASTGGGITDDLARLSESELRALFDGDQIRLSVLSAQPCSRVIEGQPQWVRCVAGLARVPVTYNEAAQVAYWYDVGGLLLQRGRARVHLLAAMELPPDVFAMYVGIEAEARAARRGWWAYEWLMPNEPIERKERGPITMPERQPSVASRSLPGRVKQ